MFSSRFPPRTWRARWAISSAATVASATSPSTARLRGSQHETSPGVHMLNAFSIRLQAAVGSLVVPPDSGEVVEALELIKSLPLDGAVVTGDAAFTFKTIVEAIRQRGGDYFLFVKANQPELKAELERAFGDVSPSGRRRRGCAHSHRTA